MKLPIIYYGNPLLRKKAKEVGAITPEIQQLAFDMIETMDANQGIGLAAPQVGQLIRLFVLRNYVEAPDGTFQLTNAQVYVNPKVSLLSNQTQEDTEGCLSIPKLRAPVVRPLSIRVEALSLDGIPFVEEIEGYKARVIMHENDHLNGVLFIDRLDSQLRKKLEPDLRKIKSTTTS